MDIPQNLHLSARLTPPLEEAIHRWLAARDNFKKLRTHENQHEYNATLYDLGAAWAERYPNGANTPEAFERFSCDLIASEDE
jgi:hypothetical protein